MRVFLTILTSGLVGMALLAIIVGLLMGLPFMLLWNCLIPDLFHGPTLTFWQSFGLMLLARTIWPVSSLSKQAE